MLLKITISDTLKSTIDGKADATELTNKADKTEILNRANVSGLASKADKTGVDDIEITDTTKGVILKSPNSTCYRLTVDDTGALSAIKVTE